MGRHGIQHYLCNSIFNSNQGARKVKAELCLGEFKVLVWILVISLCQIREHIFNLMPPRCAKAEKKPIFRGFVPVPSRAWSETSGIQSAWAPHASRHKPIIWFDFEPTMFPAIVGQVAGSMGGEVLPNGLKPSDVCLNVTSSSYKDDTIYSRPKAQRRLACVCVCDSNFDIYIYIYIIYIHMYSWIYVFILI